MTLSGTLPRTLLTLLAAFIVSSLLLTWSSPAHAQVPPGLGGQIVCYVFGQLNEQGQPIPLFDSDCTATTTPTLPIPQCSDGKDNDNDGKTDWSSLPGAGDPGCATPLDDDESDDPTPPGGGDVSQCSDGQDNDKDGKVDMEDPGCANPEDNDETDPDGGDGGGGGGPAQCADNKDNDSDGLIDTNDPGCHSDGDVASSTTYVPSDDDETDEGGVGGGGDDTSGGGGGGHSSHRSSGSSGGGGEVLGASDCREYLTSYLHTGWDNDVEQVARLQAFLRQFEDIPLSVNGVYDAPTIAAVNAFQAKYDTRILEPWGIDAPTSFVYFTTRKTVNEIYCDDEQAFPLTPAQQAIVNASKAESGQ